MIKVFLLKFKIYFMIAALLAVVIGTWKVRGWYEDGIVKDALLKQKEAYEKQAEIDVAALLVAIDKQQVMRTAFRRIRDEANKTELCANDGTDFLRLFNRGARNANTQK